MKDSGLQLQVWLTENAERWQHLHHSSVEWVLCAPRISKDCSSKKGSDKPESFGSASVGTRPATQKRRTCSFILAKFHWGQKILKTNYLENNLCTRRNPSRRGICSVLVSGQSPPGLIKEISAHVAQSIFSFSAEAPCADPIYDLLTCGMGLRPPLHFTGASEQLSDGNGFPSPSFRLSLLASNI